MSSFSGYVAYVRYTAGTSKGQTARDTLINDPFQLGNVDVNYTGDRVVESLTAGTGNVLAWTPFVHGAFPVGDPAVLYDARVTHSDGTAPTYLYIKAEDGKLYTTDAYTTEYTASAGDKVAYVYDNIVIPQEKLATVKADVQGIPLLAHARRVAIYFSQMAAFQAKTDMGLDLGQQLAEQAVGRLEYEIDTEITDLLASMAQENIDEGTYTELTWSKQLPVGVSKFEHYNGFTETIEDARRLIYDATKRFNPNWMLISSSVLPVLTFIRGFDAAPRGSVNGPYLAGTLAGLKVYVTPNLAAGKFVVGVNGTNMEGRAAVFAPYMAVVPTMLLQNADGGTSQGLKNIA